MALRLEPPRGCADEGTPRSLFLVDQIELILANFVGAELLGGLAKKLTELVDVEGVRIDGGWGQVLGLTLIETLIPR